MNGLAILGLFLILYGVVVVTFAARKPKSVWETGKVRYFISLLGNRGTVVFFYAIAAVALGFGIWLLVK